jgi:hypothetical protein
MFLQLNIFFVILFLLPTKKVVSALTGFVGETDKNSENKHYLYTHKNILVKYNDNRVGVLHYYISGPDLFLVLIQHIIRTELYN